MTFTERLNHLQKTTAAAIQKVGDDVTRYAETRNAQIVAAISALEAQIEDLKARVEQLEQRRDR